MLYAQTHSFQWAKWSVVQGPLNFRRTTIQASRFTTICHQGCTMKRVMITYVVLWKRGVESLTEGLHGYRLYNSATAKWEFFCTYVTTLVTYVQKKIKFKGKVTCQTITTKIIINCSSILNTLGQSVSTI